MKTIPIKQPLVVTVLSLTLASCALMKPYKQPDITSDKLYRGVQTADSSTLASLSWREMFTDPKLQQLIEQGINNNLDLKIAVTRLQTAQANLQQSRLALLPSLSVGPQYTRSKSSSAQIRSFGIGSTSTGSTGTTETTTLSLPTVDIYALLGSASWEADIWGKLRSTKRAYLASLLQSEAYKRAVQTQLIADIATNYYTLLAYDKQLAITEQTLKNRLADVETMKALKQGDVVTGADVVQSEANRYSAEVAIPDLKRSIRETENALSILLSTEPDSILRTRLDDQHPVTSLQTGLPAQLLANRPDVQQAELSFRNAFELTNVARTYFYPSLIITGSAGWATASTLKGFFDGTFYGSLVAGLTQPIFNKGLNTQRLRTAENTQAEAFYTFQSTVLTAGQEVSNALYSYQMAVEKSGSRQLQLQSLEKAVDFTKELLRYTTSTNYNDVLTSEQNLLTAQLNGVNDRLQQLLATVTLYRALGGGWR
ncbi:efflux transporter outer membrane subunit [Spirosoma soli]|uniref:Efflux transporter outer membrane subunit n=1 Tax=Spirosoma soli TaxID=1770529 RepID=A0ABW5M2C2_9BACT